MILDTDVVAPGRCSTLNNEVKNLDPFYSEPVVVESAVVEPVVVEPAVVEPALVESVTTHNLVTIEQEKRPRREKCRWVKSPQSPKSPKSPNTDCLVSAGVDFQKKNVTANSQSSNNKKLHPAIAKPNKVKPDPLRRVATINLPKFKLKKGTLWKQRLSD